MPGGGKNMGTFYSFQPLQRQSSRHRRVFAPHLVGGAQWRAEGQLTEASWPVSPAWAGEAGAEAAGGGTAGAGPPRRGGAAGGGVEEAWSLRCCGAGRA